MAVPEVPKVTGLAHAGTKDGARESSIVGPSEGIAGSTTGHNSVLSISRLSSSRRFHDKKV